MIIILRVILRFFYVSRKINFSTRKTTLFKNYALKLALLRLLGHFSDPLANTPFVWMNLVTQPMISAFAATSHINAYQVNDTGKCSHKKIGTIICLSRSYSCTQGPRLQQNPIRRARLARKRFPTAKLVSTAQPIFCPASTVSGTQPQTGRLLAEGRVDKSSHRALNTAWQFAATAGYVQGALAGAPQLIEAPSRPILVVASAGASPPYNYPIITFETGQRRKFAPPPPE